MSMPRAPLVAQSTTTTTGGTPTVPSLNSLTALFKAIKAADMMVLNDNRADIQAAIKIYTQAINFPNHGSIVCYKSRAGAYQKLGKFAEALQDFTIYLEQHKQDLEAWIQKAWCHFCLKQHPEMLESATTALKLNPQSRDAQYCLISFAKSFIKETQHTQAIDCLKLVLEHNPQHSKAYILLGAVYATERDLTNSIANYEQALRQHDLSPEKLNHIHKALAEVYATLAVTLLSTKQYNQAMDACLTARKHNSEYPGLYCAMGNICLETKKYTPALNHFKKALELKTKYAEAFIGLGNVYAEKKAYNLAEQQYKEGLKCSPHHPDIHNNLGIVYYEQGRYSEALTAFTTCIRNSSPQSQQAARAYSNRARIYQATNKIPAAIEELKLSLQIEDSSLEKEYLINLYQLQYTEELKAENFQSAINSLTAALPYASDVTALKQGLASCHFRLGMQIAENDLDLGIQHLDTALEYDPLSANNFCNRGVLLFRKSKVDKALQDFAKALELDDKHFPTLQNLGVHYYYQKNYDESIKHLKKVWDGGTLLASRRMLIQAYLGRAQKYSEANKLDEAISDQMQLSILAPDCAEYKKSLAHYHQIRATQRASTGQNTEAIEDLKQAIQLDPALPDLKKSLVTLYVQEGIRCFHSKQHETAIDFFKEAIKQEPEHPLAPYYYAHALIAKNKLSEAIPYFKECIRLNPGFSDAYNDLGVTLRALNYRPEEIIPWYQSALQHKPDSTTGSFNLANLYYDLNDLQAAYRHYQQALKANPEDQDAATLLTELYPLLFNRGVAYISDEKYLEATKDFACLAQRETKNVDVHYNCGMAFCLAGQFKAALPYLKQAEEGDQKDHKIHYYLGWAYEETRDFKAALNKYRLVKQQAPEFAQDRGLDQKLASCSKNLEAETKAFKNKQSWIPRQGNYTNRHFKPKPASHDTHHESWRGHNPEPQAPRKGFS